MRTLRIYRWLSAIVALASVAHAAPPPRSVSTSRQFIVYASDAQLRGAICDLAEQTKRAALKILQERDAWKTPIIVNAQLPQAQLPELSGIRLNVSQTGFGLKLQLDLTLDVDVSGPSIKRELLRAIFLEMMYRAAPETPAGAAYVEPPDWLLEGTLALNDDTDHAPLAEVLRSPVESGTVLSLDQVVRTRSSLLDSPSRALFRAYSAALVAAITQSPGGARQLVRFLADLRDSPPDVVTDFCTHFPLFRTPEKMEKDWLLAVARFSASERFRLLSSAETERELTRILRVELQGKDQPTGIYTLEEFPRFVGVSAARHALKNVREQLLLLSGQASPLYRPILAEYDQIILKLDRGKTKRLPARLAELRAMREQLARRMDAIADYMNWFEATQSKANSGAFRDYLRAAESAAETDYHRRDAISVYLDALAAQF